MFNNCNENQHFIINIYIDWRFRHHSNHHHNYFQLTFNHCQSIFNEEGVRQEMKAQVVDGCRNRFGYRLVRQLITLSLFAFVVDSLRCLAWSATVSFVKSCRQPMTGWWPWPDWICSWGTRLFWGATRRCTPCGIRGRNRVVPLWSCFCRRGRGKWSSTLLSSTLLGSNRV